MTETTTSTDTSTTTAARPMRADAARNRERVLAAAATVFARHGLASTLDQVADEAGVGVGTVYRRFTGRDELVQLVFEQRMTRIAERLEHASTADDVWAALVTTTTTIAGDMADDRGLRQLVDAVMIPSPAALGGLHDRLEAAGNRLVSRAVAQGSMRPDAQGLDIGIILRCVMSAADMTEGDGWRRYLAIMLDGLRARGTDNSPLSAATVIGMPRFHGA